MEESEALDAARWERVQNLFLQAIERPPDERAVFVEEVSSGDAELRHELTSLLRSHEETGLMDIARGADPSPVERERVARLSDGLADRYRVLGEIGKGGMATVLLAEDLRHGRKVAVKVLRTEVASSFADRHFQREIEISAKLRHPHILPLYDSGESGGIPYFVMPYVEGESLRARLDRLRRLPVEGALRVAAQTADALGHAHSRGMIHRDVKPGNILLEDRHAVLADFGIGRAVEFVGETRLTETGVSLGTPTYMSPEQMSGRELDARSDLYSLACVVFEMIAGRPPFEGRSVVDLVRQHVFEEPPSLSELVPSLPSGLSDAVGQGLRKDPGERFQTAEQLIDALTGRQRGAESPHATPLRKLTALLSADVEGYTRLMAADEAGTLRALTACRELIATSVRRHGGRVVDAPGDNVLAEFASVVQAVEAAVEIQRGIAERNAAVQGEPAMRFRIGINIGDVIVEGSSLYGEGVNLAARLEALADPGGICVSDDVHRQVQGRLPIDFEDLGPRDLKNISRPVRVFRILLGHDGGEPGSGGSSNGAPEQEIRFCTAPDGVRLGYAVAGQGPPLVKTANWLNHLEYDWQSPIWAPFFRALVRDHTLIRYDARGNGLSDWDVPDVSLEAFVQDLATVVDAAGLERFPLLGISQGCAVSIEYAVRHPDRVTRLVLYGGYARGFTRRGRPGEVEQAEAIITLMAQGWGQENPAYRQIFTSRFIPEATPEQARWFDDLQRMTASPENAVRIRRAINDIDVEELLPRIRVPTLVLHCRDDATVPFEEGRRMASRIEGARFVALPGKNHLVMEDDPGWPRFVEEIRSFLEDA